MLTEWVALIGDIDGDDVVIFEPFDLERVRDIDAGFEGEVLMTYPPQFGDVRSLERLSIRLGDLWGSRDYCDRRLGLAVHQTAERFGDKGDPFPQMIETKEGDRCPLSDVSR